MKSLLTVKAPASQHGFSLMEMAVVLMILGTLMSGVLVAVSQTTENNRRTNALVQLRQIEEALYGFAQTHGRLPCPASDSSNGIEVTDGGFGCAIWYGFVPASTLALYGSINAEKLLLDAWGNPFRYAVGEFSHSGNYVFTSQVNLRSFYNASGAGITNANMLRICNNSTCEPDEIISDTIPALILSMGADWATCTSANEIANSCEFTSANGYSLPADKDFVKRDYAEDLFDDQLIWLSPYVLFNKLITAGKLP